MLHELALDCIRAHARPQPLPPPPPPPPRLAVLLASASSTSTSALPTLPTRRQALRQLPSSVRTAGPQPASCPAQCSVCTAGPQPGTCPAQCAPLDLNRGPSQLSVHRWTSTWDLPSSVCTARPQPGTCPAQCAPLDLNGQIECQKICQMECQIECQKIGQVWKFTGRRYISAMSRLEVASLIFQVTTNLQLYAETFGYFKSSALFFFKRLRGHATKTPWRPYDQRYGKWCYVYILFIIEPELARKPCSIGFINTSVRLLSSMRTLAASVTYPLNIELFSTHQHTGGSCAQLGTLLLFHAFPPSRSHLPPCPGVCLFLPPAVLLQLSCCWVILLCCLFCFALLLFCLPGLVSVLSPSPLSFVLPACCVLPCLFCAFALFFCCCLWLAVKPHSTERLSLMYFRLPELFTTKIDRRLPPFWDGWWNITQWSIWCSGVSCRICPSSWGAMCVCV